jgi:hypothetical protein
MQTMKPQQLLPLILFITAWLLQPSIFAETVHLINGDLIQAKIISLDEHSLTIESEILGSLHIPREKVARIDFITQSIADKPLNSLNTSHSLSSNPGIPQLAIPGPLNSEGSTDLIKQVQQQMLTTAGSEANEMYQDMVQGVVSGKINVPQLKAMAEDTVQQIEELQAELGDDVGFALDGYLSILKGFIQKAE